MSHCHLHILPMLRCCGLIAHCRRSLGVALLGYTVLAFLAVATRSAHWTVIATLAFYNIAATINNALAAGVGNIATVVHIVLSVWLLWCLFLLRRAAA